ncbi:hypothetical protein CAOG_04136 [Capsaspora owczarzaki ATCC 30864]|uniref:U-box domain-containing protein n=1 Tax=Capsaspora owczarzaki (strain ATCC 30864) TaxID=595528 RepID=A0A0D2WPJ0_CAPO3|nr:hypothetical protein CAOG_04136 [Capsaspora owczarzaki ATCC 30864]KJE93330.1 hypothetical protein CAOG_004136 [Capsaspora owczarzaki ATCC 30864]|eukprot:XP_004347961.1 hypothetical protein CAOG_04136 [Capsaspora owczarzaki ATCC 30864]
MTKLNWTPTTVIPLADLDDLARQLQHELDAAADDDGDQTSSTESPVAVISAPAIAGASALAYTIDQRAGAADDEHVAAAAHIVALLAASESNRGALREAGLVAPLAKALQPVSVASLNAKAPRQIMRALANMSFDNDETRAQIIAAGAVASQVALLVEAVAALRSSPGSVREGTVLLRICAGFVLNVSADNADSQKAFVEAGAVAPLVTVVEKFVDTAPDAVTMSLRALASLAEVEQGKAALLGASIVPVLVDALSRTSDEGVQELSVAALELLVEDESGRVQFAGPLLLHKLIVFVNSGGNGLATSEVIGSVAKVVSTALTEDECMLPMFQPSTDGNPLSEFLRWMEHSEATVRMAGALSVGNLARRDDHCMQLFAAGIVAPLSKLFPATDAREQHAALGAIKNLSMPADNKEKMLTSQLLDDFNPLLHSPHTAIQYLAVSTLRSLCNNCGANVPKLLARDEILLRCIELLKSEHVGTQCESGRLFCNLIRYVDVGETIDAVIAIPGALDAVSSLFASEHVMLHGEAIFALSVLVKVRPGTVDKLLHLESKLLKIAQSSTTANASPVVSANALTLLLHLFTAAPTQQLSTETTEGIQDLAQDETVDPILRAKAKEVADALASLHP